MKFLITGADRQTGEDVEMSFEAADEREALGKANGRGILVTACKPSSGMDSTSAFSPSRSPFPFAQGFFDRFVFQGARRMNSSGKMRAIWALALLGTVLFSLAVLVGVLGFLPGNDIPLWTAVVLTLISVPLFLTSFANGCFLMERLNHPSEFMPHHTELHPVSHAGATSATVKNVSSRTTLPKAAVTRNAQLRVFTPGTIAAIAAVTVIGIGIGVWTLVDRENKIHPPLPKIKVTGFAASLVNFTGWKIEMTHLTGVVQFHGESFVELSYRVTSDGVLQDTGAITPPTGGRSITSQQPMSIDIYLPARPTAETEIEIIATGG